MRGAGRTTGEQEAGWRVRSLRALLRRVPRGRYRLLSALAPSHGRLIASLAEDLGGARFACDLSDALSREVCFTGAYEPPVSRVFQRYVPPGGMVVDAGANWGYFSLIAAAACGTTGKVIALEPDPRQYDALVRNVSLNAFTQVVSMRAAAAAAEGQVALIGYEDGDANRGVSRMAASDHDNRSPPRFDVAATTIDAITAPASVVDAVKIDVEGAEDLVLEGMRTGLASRRYRAILLELHPSLLRARGVDPGTCLQRLHEWGYRGWTIDASPAAYRRAIDPGVSADALLRPLDEWRRSAWPHLLWLC